MQFWGSGEEMARITSVFDYPNALALFLTPLLGFFLTLKLENYRFFQKNWIEITGMIAMATALILTFSRGAWFALIVTILFLGLKKLGPKKIILPGIIIILILLSLPDVRNRLTTRVSDASSHAHAELMRVGIDKLSTNPFLGNGLYGFRTSLEESEFRGEILNYPHNIFLNFWLELGLLGLISFALICVLVFEQYKKHTSPIRFAAGIFMIIIILHGLVDVPYFKNDLSILFWFMVSLAYLEFSKT